MCENWRATIKATFAALRFRSAVGSIATLRGGSRAAKNSTPNAVFKRSAFSARLPPHNAKREQL